MARKIVPTSGIFPYHITNRTVNREDFPLPLENVWEIMTSYLWFIHKVYEVRIFSFVLMPNHFHLLLSTPQKNLSESMHYFNSQSSKRMSERSGRINQIFGSRYSKTLIGTELYFQHAYKYVYRNPVKASLCEKVEDYRYSTLRGILGISRCLVPIEEDAQFFNPDFRVETLPWLNTKPSDQNVAAVKAALRRSEFKIPLNKNTKKPSPLETELF